MTDQERDALLLDIRDRLERIERTMVTQDDLEQFMKITFGEMVSVTRFDKGMEALRKRVSA